jgi:multidrug resistance efflux pump
VVAGPDDAKRRRRFRSSAVIAIPRAKLVPIAVVCVALIAALLVALHAWRLPPFTSAVEATEDAYVRGNVTIVAPKVDGYVADVAVKDFERVGGGQVVVRLDDRNYRHKLDQARGNLRLQESNLANLEQTRRAREASVASAAAQIAAAQAQAFNARAQLDRANADLGRVEHLVADGSLSQRERDQTVAALRQAEAAVRQGDSAIAQTRAGKAAAEQDLQAVAVNRQALEGSVEAARAAVRLAEFDLENTVVRAPRDGRVGEVGVKLGQYVQPGTQLMAVVPSQVWVVANFKERQTAHMAAGQSASLRVDALADAKLTGHVERISPATGSEFSVIKPDNATGNFIKIPQRLLVRITVDPGQPLADRLRPGMSVLASVDTATTRAASVPQP